MPNYGPTNDHFFMTKKKEDEERRARVAKNKQEMRDILAEIPKDEERKESDENPWAQPSTLETPQGARTSRRLQASVLGLSTSATGALPRR